MITVRRASDRRYERRRKHEAWLTFDPGSAESPYADGFGALEFFNEDRLPPGAAIARHPRHDAEIVTYAREGSLAWEDSMGRSTILRAGEFQRVTALRSTRHSETNASRSDWAHVFQVWLRPSQPDLEPGQEQKRFSAGERRGQLCLIASPDGRRGSLRLGQDTLVYSALLDPGQHLVHELLPGRGAWLHVLHGEVLIDGQILSAGDGAAVSVERAVSVTARVDAEILLLDLGEPEAC